MYNLGDFNFSNGVSELQMKLPSFWVILTLSFYSVYMLKTPRVQKMARPIRSSSHLTIAMYLHVTKSFIL